MSGKGKGGHGKQPYTRPWDDLRQLPRTPFEGHAGWRGFGLGGVAPAPDP